jgi:hypothetical protein
MEAGPRYIASTRTLQKTPVPAGPLLLHDVAIGMDRVENTASQSYSIAACVPVAALK